MQQSSLLRLPAKISCASCVSYPLTYSSRNNNSCGSNEHSQDKCCCNESRCSRFQSWIFMFAQRVHSKKHNHCEKRDEQKHVLLCFHEYLVRPRKLTLDNAWLYFHAVVDDVIVCTCYPRQKKTEKGCPRCLHSNPPRWLSSDHLHEGEINSTQANETENNVKNKGCRKKLGHTSVLMRHIARVNSA